mgnify:CR=1 FL=1
MILLILFLQVDSISLQQAIDIALSKSPLYQESKVSLEKSRILFYQSLSHLLPTVSTTGSYTHSEYNEVVTKRYSGTMNFNVPLFDLDVLGSIVVAAGQTQSAAIQYNEAVTNLILRLKSAYYNLISGNELLRSSEIAIKRALENQKLVETKYDLGSASKLELLQAEVFYLRSLEDKSRAKTLTVTAQEELKSILDINKEFYPTDTLAMPEQIELPPLDSLVTVMDKVNFNIQLARKVKNIAKANLIFTGLAFLPKVSAFYGYTNSSDSLIFDFQYCRDNATKNYGINVSFPIFEIKTLIFNLLTARKDLHAKELAQKRVRLETDKTLRTCYYTLGEAMDKLHLAQKSLEASTEASTIAREQYNLGAISFLDFLKAEEDFYNAKVGFIQALSDYYIQQATFSYILGEFSLIKE